MVWRGVARRGVTPPSSRHKRRWKAVEGGGRQWKAEEGGGTRWKAVEDAGDIVIFRGDLGHASMEYKESNVRLRVHAYVELEPGPEFVWGTFPF